MPHVRVTGVLNTGFRVAELARGPRIDSVRVYGIESIENPGHVAAVQSAVSLGARGVYAEELDAGGATLEVTEERLARAREISDQWEETRRWLLEADATGEPR